MEFMNTDINFANELDEKDELAFFIFFMNFSLEKLLIGLKDFSFIFFFL